MATILDIGLLNSFQIVFTFLFVFVLGYAILNKVNFPENSKGLQSFVAFIMAVFLSLSNNVAKLISTMTPWFIIMFVLIAFILIAIMMFGVDRDSITAYYKQDSTITTWILIISGVIILVSFSQVYGTEFLAFTQNVSGSSATTDVGHNVGAAIFHPRMLGMIFVLLVATFAILLLAKTPELTR